jgi:hypothetical protein
VLDRLRGDTVIRENDIGDAVSLPNEAQEQVLRPAKWRAQRVGHPIRERDDLLHARGQRESLVLGDGLVTETDYPLDVAPDDIDFYPQSCERATCHALGLTEQAEQEVLGPDVVVLHRGSLLAGALEHTACADGELAGHDRTLCGVAAEDAHPAP